MDASSPGDALTLKSYQLMVEVGKFCGLAAAGVAPEIIHTHFDRLVRRIEAHFAAEERLMDNRPFPSAAHEALHSLILEELKLLHDVLIAQDIALDHVQLERIRSMFMAEGTQEELLEGKLRKEDD